MTLSTSLKALQPVALRSKSNASIMARASSSAAADVAAMRCQRLLDMSNGTLTSPGYPVTSALLALAVCWADQQPHGGVVLIIADSHCSETSACDYRCGASLVPHTAVAGHGAVW